MRLILLRRQSVAMGIMGMVVFAVFSLIFLVVDNVIDMKQLKDTGLHVLAGKKVVIDPGHGGIDDGASANGLVEKKITLEISNKLAEVLKSHGAEVELTRTGDIDYYTKGKGGKRNDLLTRVAIIQEANADIYISIHCNAIRGVRSSGAQVFYNPDLPQSKLLAERIQASLKLLQPDNKRQAKQDKDIIVLKSSIPGVLVEVGFLTDKNDAMRLSDEGYQMKLAEYIAKGVAYHFSQDVGR